MAGAIAIGFWAIGFWAIGFWMGGAVAGERIDCPASIHLDGFGGECRLGGPEAIQGWQLREAPSDPLLGRRQCPSDSPSLVDGLVQASDGFRGGELACEYEGARGFFMVARPTPIGQTCRAEADLLARPKRVAFQCD
ncbi:MAG: hypothetical protein EXQ87_01500 [Alphaproteobacteria bacterium]|nr:hypothetical protein [Alphaproteobacteria bacterium]